MKPLKILKRILLNKYLLVLVVFACILFFGEYNLISRVKTGHKITQLEREATFYKEKIETDKQKINRPDHVPPDK